MLWECLCIFLHACWWEWGICAHKQHFHFKTWFNAPVGQVKIGCCGGTRARWCSDITDACEGQYWLQYWFSKWALLCHEHRGGALLWRRHSWSHYKTDPWGLEPVVAHGAEGSVETPLALSPPAVYSLRCNSLSQPLPLHSERDPYASLTHRGSVLLCLGTLT